MKKHLVVMAAGTGGHVMPGLAVAAEMQRRGWTVSWLGTTTGMENRLVPPSGIAMDRVAFAGMRGKGLVGNAIGALKMLGAAFACARLFAARRASAVIGMGGYVCVPGGWASRWRGLPLVLVNADAALLLSNRALQGTARRIAFGFDGPAAHAMGDKGVVTGNPVRAAIEAIAPPDARHAGRGGPLHVLVVGGSLGARVLNETLPAAVARIPAATRPRVTHQTGRDAEAAVRNAYVEAGVDDVEVLPFIDDMPERLAACDVIVCRAGAITVSELCAAGVASVLVPLVVSTTSHQRDNAEWLAGHGAAVHLPQAELTAERLATLIAGFTRDALLAMANKARALARPHAAARVADLVESVVPA